jgi:multidrug resistance efflux pump
MNTCERHGKLRCDECAYIEELRSEVETEQKHNKALHEQLELYQTKYSEAIVQAQELQKALEWYADKSKHSPFSNEMLEDCGERARTALQSIQGGDNT